MSGQRGRKKEKKAQNNKHHLPVINFIEAINIIILCKWQWLLFVLLHGQFMEYIYSIWYVMAILAMIYMTRMLNCHNKYRIGYWPIGWEQSVQHTLSFPLVPWWSIVTIASAFLNPRLRPGSHSAFSKIVKLLHSSVKILADKTSINVYPIKDRLESGRGRPWPRRYDTLWSSQITQMNVHSSPPTERRRAYSILFI